ncbi:hypothetical protein [Deinococcus sp. S9]|uniref:hypothetical protein n=1 Tax=Deinococcus sp. S9 TaxID=2545754 RepID=UPI0010557109|nr:hypothetical protein [Deinococcus sp. S9]TDE85330.1 hypothetical protein E0686_12420 [Deinococcus sp. S9]
MSRRLPAEEALALLLQEQPVEDATITGELRFYGLPDQQVGAPVILRRCHVESLLGTCAAFHAPVVMEDCTFERADFYATYFLAGATFAHCSFAQGVDFQCGGHNEPPTEFRLERCWFGGFVNFFDNWFPGPVVVRDCTFEEGSNLLGNVGQPFEVLFEVPPLLEGNSGDLTLDGS